MKNPRSHGLILITALVAAFTLGFCFGRIQSHGQVRLSVPASMLTLPPQATASTVPDSGESQPITYPINLNTATKEQLMTLPGIGETLAQRILAYRDKYGRFRTVEELMNVEGIGEKRLTEIWDLITIGG